MSSGHDFRPKPGEIPAEPGVYRFRDRSGRVIYVGKAKSLRSRVNSYFADPHALHPRTSAMVEAAASVDWTVVRTEVEALQLEYAWIKEYEPRFNVRYRDDKSYPYLAVTLGEEFPRAMVTRGAKRKGTVYFGPYAHAWAIRETLDLLLKPFPMRTCAPGVFRRAAQQGRPCLLGYIGKCSAPCVGRVDAAEHRRIADALVAFMAGDSDAVVAELRERMAAASSELDFESAARIRDDLGALERVLEKNAVVFDDRTDADLFGLIADDLEAAVQVFNVRNGRIRGQRGFVVERVEDLEEAGLLEQLLEQYYSEQQTHIPREVLVSAALPAGSPVPQWLSQNRGSQVSVRVPARGAKRDLMQTVVRNATDALALHKTRRGADLTVRSQALNQIQLALDLDESPLRIECVDVSHLQGADAVASLVVFEDGLPRKSEYRRFRIKSTTGDPTGDRAGDKAGDPTGDRAGDRAGDDAASIAEVVRRRFRAAPGSEVEGPAITGAEVDVDGSGIDQQQRPSRFAYRPNLLLVDGGTPQVQAAAQALLEVGVHDVAVAGLAKRLEEVWLPDDPEPVILSRSSDGLYLLQRIRDEAHRFAITYHRTRRSKSMTRSALDEIPGVGPTRRKALLAAFGSVKALRKATVEEIAAVPGIGATTAELIARSLAQGLGPPATSAVNMATGEVVGETDEHEPLQ